MTKKEQAVYDLIKAGWCQYTPYQKDDKGNPLYCMLGAMVEVGLGKRSTNKVLKSIHAKDFLSISSFNDDNTTTKRKVLTLLRKAWA